MNDEAFVRLPDKGFLRSQPSKVRSIMLTNDEVGKIQKNVPVAMAIAVELFMVDLIQKSLIAHSTNTLTPDDIRRTILKIPLFDFLSPDE